MKGAQDNVNSGSKVKSEIIYFLYQTGFVEVQSDDNGVESRAPLGDDLLRAKVRIHRVGRCELWWMSERSGDLIHVASQSRYEERKWRRRAQHDYLLCVTQGEWKWKINKIFFLFLFQQFRVCCCFWFAAVESSNSDQTGERVCKREEMSSIGEWINEWGWDFLLHCKMHTVVVVVIRWRHTKL